MANRTSPPSGLLVTGVVVLLLGLAGCGVGGWRIGSFTRSAVNAIGDADPKPFGVALRFTATGEAAAVLLSTTAVCEATDGTGRKVALDEVWANVDKKFSDGSTTYTQVLGLQTVEGRNYEVVCQATAGAGQYTVVPLPGRLGPVLAVGATGLVGGAVLTLLGIALSIAGIVRRGRWRRTNGPAGAAAPVSVGPTPAGMVTHGDVAPPPPPPGAPASPSAAAPPVMPTEPPVMPSSPPVVPPASPPIGPPDGRPHRD